MYVLDGGYKEFVALYPELCNGSYISMWDEKFITQCKEWDNWSKISWGKKKTRQAHKKQKSMIERKK